MNNLGRVLGIIAEYNPFHNGHYYHIKESIKQTDAEYVVCIVTGNFVQRGNTSIVDKWTKAKMAISQGADLVIELPTIYSTSSAENFAEGAIKILDSLQIVDELSFGIEANDISTLNNIANVLYQEPKEYITMLTHELNKGVSYPKARENALLLYLNDVKRYANVLSGSNNILGIEYLKAIKRLKSPLKPIGIKRQKVLYNDEVIIDDFASATAIRKMISTRQFDDITKVMPKTSYILLGQELKKGHYVIDLSKFQKEIIYILRKMTIDEIRELPDVSEGLENVIKNAADSCNNIIDLVNIIKSKRYTQTRIQRILIYALLGINKKMMENSRKTIPYTRILGYSDKGKALISEIMTVNPKLNLVTSVKEFLENNKNKNLKEMLQKDIYATNIYTLAYEGESKANLDFTNKIVNRQDLKSVKVMS